MNDKLIIEVIGWFGVIFYVVAYFLLTIGLLTANGYRFHFLNMLGAIGLIVVSAYYGDKPNLVVNALWLAIGIFAVGKRYFGSRTQPINTGASDN
jgi:hypothetical protein